MRRLPKPNLDVGAVYASCVQGVTDATAVTRFQAAAQDMEHLAGLYDSRAAANELHLFAASEWMQRSLVMDVLQSVEGLETSLEERGRTPRLNEVSDGRFAKEPLNVVSKIKPTFSIRATEVDMTSQPVGLH